MSMYCHKCGATIEEDDSSLCPRCADPALIRDRQDVQPEPPRMFLVPTGEMASEGVPVYRAFETLAEARDFGRGLHPIPGAIVEISLTPGGAA